jgi:hypothetical protein
MNGRRSGLDKLRPTTGMTRIRAPAAGRHGPSPTTKQTNRARLCRTRAGRRGRGSNRAPRRTTAPSRPTSDIRMRTWSRPTDWRRHRLGVRATACRRRRCRPVRTRDATRRTGVSPTFGPSRRMDSCADSPQTVRRCPVSRAPVSASPEPASVRMYAAPDRCRSSGRTRRFPDPMNSRPASSGGRSTRPARPDRPWRSGPVRSRLGRVRSGRRPGGNRPEHIRPAHRRGRSRLVRRQREANLAITTPIHA